MSLPPSLQAFVDNNHYRYETFVQAIAHEACRLQREVDIAAEYDLSGSTPLVVEKPE